MIFGVTGDLSRKKLLPAIYDLANRGLLPPGFALVGFGRRDWSDEDFAEVVHESVKSSARTPYREEVWRQLAEGVRFVSASGFGDEAAFDKLAQTVDEARPHARNRWELRVLPVDPTQATSRPSSSSCAAPDSPRTRQARRDVPGGGW